MAADIPFLDLRSQQAEIEDEITPLVARTLRDAVFIDGPLVAEFESAYAQFVGVRHCVGVANGTDAIELLLRAHGIGPGDEAIVPANSFIATAEAVVRAGATPVLADVDPNTLLLSPEAVAAVVTPRTRAIIPVHLFGQMAPVEQISPLAARVGAVVIEDAAQSQGARRNGAVSGSVGDAAATSFYPGKNLGAAGDAGAVTTDSTAVAERVRTIGAHGSRQRYVHEVIGVNSRLDALQAIVLRAKLRRLEEWNRRRRDAAERYDALLADLDGVRPVHTLPGNDHVHHLYVVRVPRRAAVHTHLLSAGIGVAIHYPTPIHLTEAFSFLGLRAGAFPVSEAAADEILSLPMFPHLTPAQQERVVDVLREALHG